MMGVLRFCLFCAFCGVVEMLLLVIFMGGADVFMQEDGLVSIAAIMVAGLSWGFRSSNRSRSTK